MMKCPSGNGDQIVILRIDFNGDVLEFIEQAGVVHLPRDRPGLSGGWVAEVEDLDSFASDGLRDGHTRNALRSFGDDLDAAPLVNVVRGPNQAGEFGAAVVVLAGTIVPVAAERDLKLDTAECVQRLFAGPGTRAEDQYASLVIGIARYVAHGEHQAELAVVLGGVDDAAADTGARHGA